MHWKVDKSFTIERPPWWRLSNAFHMIGWKDTCNKGRDYNTLVHIGALCGFAL